MSETQVNTMTNVTNEFSKLILEAEQAAKDYVEKYIANMSFDLNENSPTFGKIRQLIPTIKRNVTIDGYTYDLLTKIEHKQGEKIQIYNNKVYLFDVVDYPLIMTSPEFINMSIKKLFDKVCRSISLKHKFCNEGLVDISYVKSVEDCEKILKPHVNLISESWHELDITPDYLFHLIKYIKCEQSAIKYTMLSTLALESIYKCVDNRFVTGRADRVYKGGHTGPNYEQTAIVEINKYAVTGKGKKLRLGEVYLGRNKWQTLVIT